MTTSRIGIVLSSGGGRGVYGHTGFMLALEALEIQISASAGCSAGAVVGGIAASGADIHSWAEAIIQARTAQFWTPRSTPGLFYDLFLNRGRGLLGLSDTSAPIRFLTEQLAAESFEECIYPFSAVAVNLGDCAKVVFDQGPLAARMMASAAIPGFYEPVEIDGEYFSDGATIDLAPIDAICCQHQLDVLLVHHVAQRNYSTQELKIAFEQPWPILNILHRLIYWRRPWYTSGRAREYRRCPCGCKAVVIVIEPKLPESIWPATTGAANIVEMARLNTHTQLEPILKSLNARPWALLK